MPSGWHIQDGQDAKGRRVIADKAFKPGELVLEDSNAAASLIGGQLGSYCDCCLAAIQHPLRCSACKLAAYANQEHQKHAWRRGAHRLECAALRACAPHTPPTAVRLALRCVLRRWQAASSGQPDDSRFEEVLGLQHHWEDLQDAAKVEFAQMGAAAHHLLQAAAQEAAERYSPRDLALLIARFGCNSHTISDDELRPIAVGIFPLGAMVNHDCRPNTVHTFKGGRMLFRAVRPIQAGEEVTTSYAELAATRWERRAALLRHHQFDIDAPPAGSPTAAAAGGAATAAAAAPGDASNGTGSSSQAAAEGNGSDRLEGRRRKQEAVLQCVPPQQPAAAVPLPGCNAELRMYSCQQPPWPHDERDIAMTAVHAVSSNGREGSSGAVVGGIWGSLQQAASSHPAAGESFGVDGDIGEDGLEGLAGGRLADGSARAPPGAASAATAVLHFWSPAVTREHRAAAQQLAQQYAAALELQQGLEAMLSSGQAAAAVSRLRQALAVLTGQAAGASGAPSCKLVLGQDHVLRLRLLADLQRAALAAQDWRAALAAARQLLPLYESAYQPVWPQTGLLHGSIAKLAHLLEQPAQAVHAAQAAVRILRITHGSGGSVVQEMERIEFEARQELQYAERQGRLRAGGEAEEEE